jgi:hypothetical protein
LSKFVGDDHVGLRHDAVEDRAPLVRVRVEDQALLGHRRLRGEGDHDRRRMLRPHRIDLDDRRPELDEHASTGRAGDDVAQVDDGEAG